jgi:hypothetical protein
MDLLRPAHVYSGPPKMLEKLEKLESSLFENDKLAATMAYHIPDHWFHTGDMGYH